MSNLKTQANLSFSKAELNTNVGCKSGIKASEIFLYTNSAQNMNFNGETPILCPVLAPKSREPYLLIKLEA